MTRRTAAAVFLLCAAPRLLALLAWPFDTSTLYFQLAADIAAHGRAAFATEIGGRIEPMYPLLLAAGRLVAGESAAALLLIQIAVASGAGVALFSLTKALTDSTRAAWTAAVLYAASPYLIRQSVSFMEVTLAVSLLIAFASTAAQRGSGAAAASGALLAAVVLTRAAFLPIAVGGILLLARSSVRAGAAAGIACAACLGIWTIAARSAGASPFPARAGENLLVSTSEWTRAVVPRTNVDVLMPLADQQARDALRERGVPNPTPRELDRMMLDEALAYARAHPWETVALKLRNAAYCLQPRLLPFSERRGSAEVIDGAIRIPPQAPRPLLVEIAAGAFQALLLAGGVAGMWKRRYHLGGTDAVLILIAASIVAVNVAFFPTSRLLAPMTFVLMFYTAVAVGR
jgi:hypothetical protein